MIQFTFITLFFLGPFFHTWDSLKIKRCLYILASKEWAGRPANLRTAKLFKKFLRTELPQYFFKRQKFFYEENGVKIYAENFYFYPQKCGPKILIIAHYDHLGNGGEKSKEFGNRCIHFGADDNASGVVLALSLFDSLIASGHPKERIAIALFSGHEAGLFGSKNFSTLNCIKKYPPKIVFNFDMIGRLSSDAPTLRFEYSKIFDVLNCQNIKILQEKLNSFGDHLAFENLCQYLFFFTTGIHNDYHKCSDTADKINVEGVIEIQNCLLDFIKKIE